MPEGDSLHRAAQRLGVLVGERIEAESVHPRGVLTGVARAVDGRVLDGVDAVGKHLLLRFEGRVVVRSHLGMRGRWRVGPRGAAWHGRPWLVLRGREWEATQWNGPVLALGTGSLRALGPDLLAEATDVADVVQRLRRIDGQRLLGEALVDQRVVSGVGNVWIAEALWHARLSPWRALATVTDEELQRVLGWTRSAMRESVSGARPRKAVHRRAGRSCPRCGTPIVSRGLGERNRTAYWCPRCQPSGA